MIKERYSDLELLQSGAPPPETAALAPAPATVEEYAPLILTLLLYYLKILDKYYCVPEK